MTKILEYIKENPITFARISAALSAFVSLILVIISYLNDYGYMVQSITANLDPESASILTTVLFICIALAAFFNFKGQKQTDEQIEKLEIKAQMLEQDKQTLYRKIAEKSRELKKEQIRKI